MTDDELEQLMRTKFGAVITERSLFGIYRVQRLGDNYTWLHYNYGHQGRADFWTKHDAIVAVMFSGGDYQWVSQNPKPK